MNRLQHVRSSGLGAIMCKSCATHPALKSGYHVQHVVLHAMWYKGTAQLSTYQVCPSLSRIYLSFILLAEPLTNWEGEETGVPRENPGD